MKFYLGIALVWISGLLMLWAIKPERVVTKTVEVKNTQFETVKFCQELSAMRVNTDWQYKNCLEELQKANGKTSILKTI